MGWTGFTVSDQPNLAYLISRAVAFPLKAIVVCEPLLRVGYYSDPTTRNPCLLDMRLSVNRTV